MCVFRTIDEYKMVSLEQHVIAIMYKILEINEKKCIIGWFAEEKTKQMSYVLKRR